MNLSGIRSAIADALADVQITPALVVTAYVPNSVVVPAAWVQPDTITYDATFGRGTDEFAMLVEVLVSATDDRASQTLLDAMLAGAGPASVKAAIESRRGANGYPGGTLGGLADDLHVTGVEAYRWIQVGATSYLGAQFKVRLIGAGSS